MDNLYDYLHENSSYIEEEPSEDKLCYYELYNTMTEVDFIITKIIFCMFDF